MNISQTATLGVPELYRVRTQRFSQTQVMGNVVYSIYPAHYTCTVVLMLPLYCRAGIISLEGLVVHTLYPTIILLMLIFLMMNAIYLYE